MIYAYFAFYQVGFYNNSDENFIRWVKILLIEGVSGSTIGFLFGMTFTDHTNALIFLNMFTFIIYFSSGVFANLSPGTNFIIDTFSPLSPFTYCCEEMMRTLLQDRWYHDQILDFYNFNYGTETCIERAFMIILTFFLLTWFVTVFKAKIVF
jgi:hypothetical protein